MEPNTHCSDIKYFYLELLAFYIILIGLSGELFWNKGTANKAISKHALHKEVAKKAPNVLPTHTKSQTTVL